MAQRILVVDDDPHFRNFVTAALDSQGFEVTHAEDGLTAVSLAQKMSPDLILLDLDLPAGDGLTVLERMKKLPRLMNVPVLVVTSRPAAISREKALRKAAAGFLQKPVDVSSITSAVRGCLGSDSDPLAGGGECCPTCGRKRGEMELAASQVEAIAERVGDAVLRQLAATGIGTGPVVGDGPQASTNPGPESPRIAPEGAPAAGPPETPPETIPPESPIIVEVAPEVDALVPEYLERRAHDLRLLNDALARDDLAVVQLIGHRLQANSEGLGFEAIVEFGRELERCAGVRDRHGMADTAQALGRYLRRVNVVCLEDDRQ